MPWCEDCSKFWTPTSLAADGSCPTCGRRVATVEAPPRAPWHFKLMVVAVIIYLLYRLVQLIEWFF